MSEIVFYIAGALSLLGALYGLGAVLYAMWTRRDRKYREAHERFLEQKRRFDERFNDAGERFDSRRGR
jgi:pilus assembly protein TadC